MIKRSKSLFYKKIKCFHCGGNFKVKKERSTIKYICSTYDNSGVCIRIPIEEIFLIELIEKRLGIPISREVVEGYVESIMVEEHNLLEIKFKNQESILLSRTHIRY